MQVKWFFKFPTVASPQPRDYDCNKIKYELSLDASKLKWILSLILEEKNSKDVSFINGCIKVPIVTSPYSHFDFFFSYTDTSFFLTIWPYKYV
jgi:hypothetical protein